MTINLQIISEKPAYKKCKKCGLKLEKVLDKQYQYICKNCHVCEIGIGK